MKKMWLIGSLVLLMLACNALTFPRSTPTPEIVFPSPVLVTPTSIESPPTEGPQTGDRPFSAIIARSAPISFYLLGGTENGEWLSAETVVPHLTGGEEYRLYGLGGLSGLTEGQEPLPDQICPLYWVATDSGFPGGLEVGVTGNWDATPRLAQEIPSDHPTYVEAIRDWLIAQSVPEPVVEISQILRVDLEGDGTDEVLISASHFVEPTGHDVAVGDYSLILMRKVVGDSVQTVPVVDDYYYQDVDLQFPLTYNGLLVADLNNDGVLEAVVGVERWEGSGVMVFEIDGTNVRSVFKALCGL
jgi:hypothetical protein